MKPWKRTCATTLAALMLCGTAVAANNIITQKMEVNYMGIKLVVNGVEVTPTDAAGTAVEPFTSNGTTYLPVRAVANALGQAVEWDGETRTVYIGDVPGKATSWMTKLPPYQVNEGQSYDGTDHKSFFTVAGVDHAEGVTLTYSKALLRDEIDQKIASALWNTNCQYKTMNLTIGHMGDSQDSAKLEVYLDGVYSTTYDLPWDAAPKTLSIPLNYAANVKLQIINSMTAEEYRNSFPDPDSSDAKWAYGSHKFDAPYGIYDISFVE